MATHFKSLTKAEEEIMQVLWQLEKAFIKDVVDALPEPRPHYNTVSTIVKILEDKGFVSHESLGKSNRYFPVVAKDDYSKRSMKQFVKRYFDGSFASMLSFFAKEEDISVKELQAILNELKKSSPKK